MTAVALPSVPFNPAERLATLIDGLCKAIAAHGVRGMLAAPLLLLLWSRLRRMAGRAERLAQRIAANRPLSTPRPPSARPTPARPYVRLPGGFAWLVRAVPGTAAGASQLQVLLADPGMAALAQTPPMRRLLRPLCRLLGVRPPPAAPSAPKQPTAAPPAPDAGGALDPPPAPHTLRTPTPGSAPCRAPAPSPA